MVSHWSLSDSKSPQVSRTRLRILAVLSNAVVWIVSTRPPTSKSSMPFNNLLVIVPKAPITIDTIVTFMFHSFFNSLARSSYLSFFSLSFRFILWSAGTAKSTQSLKLFTSALADGFHWSLSDIKSALVSRTLLTILVVLNNAVVWMVSTRPPISKSSSPLSNPLVTVPITISIIVTCMFYSFFQFPSKVEVLILLFTFFQFYSVDNKVDYFEVSLFFFFVNYY